MGWWNTMWGGVVYFCEMEEAGAYIVWLWISGQMDGG